MNLAHTLRLTLPGDTAHGMRHPERVLEVGGALAGASLLVALGALVLGRIAGGLRRSGRGTAAAPAAGSVSAERHRHIGGSSPR